LGNGYGDNPKYIARQLLKKNKYDLVWACRENQNQTLPEGIRASNSWFRYLKEFATAKIWISNVRLPRYIKKRKGQYYIQTWHGGLALKKIEKDAEQVLSKEYVENAIYDSKRTDIMLTNSDYGVKLYKRAFWYEGPILCNGLPRNDDFINLKNEVKNKPDELKNYKVVLYAPTFRATNNSEAYNIDLENLIKKLNKATKFKWKVIVKLHPNMLDSSFINFNKNIINYSMVSDINDLLLITDILITDYSSVMFDYMLLNKPIILYAADIEEYKRDRDFSIKLEDVPFEIAKNNNELFEIIENMKTKDYKKIYEIFGKEYGLNETGRASDEVVKIIEEKVAGEK
jgi:CDP-glycerol glycerophosphotransferase